MASTPHWGKKKKNPSDFSLPPLLFNTNVTREMKTKHQFSPHLQYDRKSNKGNVPRWW